jgi:hypothetical protein
MTRILTLDAAINALAPLALVKRRRGYRDAV